MSQLLCMIPLSLPMAGGYYLRVGTRRLGSGTRRPGERSWPCEDIRMTCSASRATQRAGE